MMTETITDRTVDTAATETPVTKWLADFDRALTARNVDAAAALFVEDCYWRDLVAFTWNIITIEGSEAVRKLLAQTLDQVQPAALPSPTSWARRASQPRAG
jgi:putative flavoprotein involved in K+ transport